MRVRSLNYILLSLLGLFIMLHGGIILAADSSSINARELLSMIKNGKAVTIIDVRTPEEFNEGHIPGSISIHGIKDLKAFHHEEKVVLYCTSGVRSKKALEVFAEKGIKASDLEGGIKAWIAAGGNVVKGPYQELSEYPEAFDIPKGVCETKEPVKEFGK